MTCKQYDWIYRRGYVPISKQIVKFICREMKERGITISQLAKQTGWSRPYLSNVLHGKNEPSLQLLEELLDALGRTLVIADKPD